MPWRVRYLANLIMVMNDDGHFSPREALVLSEVRKELRLSLHEMAEAVIQAVGERQPQFHANVITNERNLVEMFAGLLVDGAERSQVLDVFIDQSAIPKHRLPALLDDARERYEQLHKRITTSLHRRNG